MPQVGRHQPSITRLHTLQSRSHSACITLVNGPAPLEAGAADVTALLRSFGTFILREGNKCETCKETRQTKIYSAYLATLNPTSSRPRSP